MKKTNTMLNGMMGLVVGDALGCPVQFLSREEIQASGVVTDMQEFGTYNMPKGTWTDDSSMALAALVSLKEKGCIDPVDLMERFLDWHLNGAYTPYGQAFDQGLTCTTAILSFRHTRDVQTCGRTGEHANGNGALMRILPVCIYCAEKVLDQNTEYADDEAIQDIHTVAALTHNHLRSNIACGLYYFMVKELLKVANAEDHPAEPASAHTETHPAEPASANAEDHPAEPASANAEDHPAEPASAHTDNLTALLQKGLDAGFAYYEAFCGQDDWSLEQLAYYDRTRDLKAFVEMDPDGIRSSGYVLHTFEAVVWSLINTDNFRDGLLKAVNLGDDTDTVGAIAGGLAGLYYGYEEIPAEWLDVIVKREWLEELCC